MASGDVFIGLTWVTAAHLRSRPWFERVESSANPVDGLSRGRLEGPWERGVAVLPKGLCDLLRVEIGAAPD